MRTILPFRTLVKFRRAVCCDSDTEKSLKGKRGTEISAIAKYGDSEHFEIKQAGHSSGGAGPLSSAKVGGVTRTIQGMGSRCTGEIGGSSAGDEG
jgi:hypothetical protein